MGKQTLTSKSQQLLEAGTLVLLDSLLSAKVQLLWNISQPLPLASLENGGSMVWTWVGSTQDQEDLQKLKAAFEHEAKSTGKEQLLLTAAVSAGDGTIELAYEVKEICEILDLVHLMAYDFHGGSWEEFTAHNAPLMGNTAGLPDTEMFNLEDATDIWFDAGCPPNKMVMGIPTYGRTYTLKDPANDYGYNATASGPGD